MEIQIEERKVEEAKRQHEAGGRESAFWVGHNGPLKLSSYKDWGKFGGFRVWGLGVSRFLASKA